jgi:hypothetical protein
MKKSTSGNPEERIVKPESTNMNPSEAYVQTSIGSPSQFAGKPTRRLDHLEFKKCRTVDFKL